MCFATINIDLNKLDILVSMVWNEKKLDGQYGSSIITIKQKLFTKIYDIIRLGMYFIYV